MKQGIMCNVFLECLCLQIAFKQHTVATVRENSYCFSYYAVVFLCDKYLNLTINMFF